VAQAAQAGVGAEVELELGGKTNPDLLGAPIHCRATVKGLYDGKFVAFGPMDGGLAIDIGPSAVVDVNGIEVILASRTYQPKDPSVLYAHGIDPAQKKILVVKSSVHFRSGFASLAARIVDADCPGLMPQDVKKLTYRRVPRPIYPLDEL
jgi:microcystin degradation protein MlrC